MGKQNTFLKSYGFSLILLASIAVGSLLGIVLKKDAAVVKPLGDIFLNLLFAIVVPLVFFSISSAVASMADSRRLGGIMGWMMLVFTACGAVASLLMVLVVMAFPPAAGLNIHLTPAMPADPLTWQDQLVKAFTVTDFSELLSKKNMLALIVFSLLTGLSCLSCGARAAAFKELLISGNEVMTRMVGFVMLYAPVGLCAYFAYLVGVFGPQLLGSYARSMAIYYPAALLYFFVFFSLYAYIAGGTKGVQRFWPSVAPLSLTALATGSSVASIPVNLECARNAGVPKDIREVVIPIGATIHMDGSCLSAVLKIALLFGIFHMNFSGWDTILTAVGIALLSGTVMSGIPGGGFLGELMIVTMYHFPLEALPVISMIGILVDPPATMVNSVGDNVSSLLVARALGGPRWMDHHEKS